MGAKTAPTFKAREYTRNARTPVMEELDKFFKVTTVRQPAGERRRFTEQAISSDGPAAKYHGEGDET